jgi:DNA primase
LPGLYSDDILDGVARANDIVEVVSGYFPLKRAGKDYVALCPFHAEKTPSFTVSPSKQIYKCFGCGRGGSVFNFVMAKENVTFPEAVRILAERAGMELPDRSGAEKQVGARRQVRDVLSWAVKRFAAALQHPKAGAPAREYLDARGIAAETIEAFQIGFAPDGWDALIRAAQRDGMPLELLEAAGLVVRRDDGTGYYDRFRGRLMFPILDPLSRPVAFGGRILGDGEPKYLNSPETVLFHKSEALYGLPQAREAIDAARRVVVVEGYFDVLMPWQKGVRNCVATLGTALTEEHVRALKRHADEVVLVFDSDMAGQHAADRGLELFLAGDVRIMITVVPQGKDPCDFCKEQGGEAFKAHLDKAQDAFRYKWDLVRASLSEASGPAAQRRALEAMLASVLKAPVLAREDLRLQRDLILGHMSKVLGVSEATLRSEFRRLRRTAGRSAAGTEVGGNLPDPVRRGRRWIKERELLIALVCRPSWLEEAVEALPPDRVETPEFRRLYEAILAAPSHRDGDIESIVRPMEDTGLASLAVQLFEAGEAVLAGRDPADTGPGPLRSQLDGAVLAIKELAEESRLAARSREAAENKTDDTQALRAYQEGRLRRPDGFVDPRAGRGRSGGT